jgi:transposase
MLISTFVFLFLSVSILELCITMRGQKDIQELIGFLFNQIDELKQVIEELKSENEELKSKLADYQTKKNSNNSSKPPSSDFSNLKKTKSLKESSGKKVGGQPGHKGSSMKMVSNPDFTEGHQPSYCNGCGNDLSNVDPQRFGKRQVVDIPEITRIVTEHQVYKKACSCGCVSKGSYPIGVDAPICYGKNTQALIAYLSARQYIPYKRLEEILRSVFGLNICQGSIKNILDKTSEKLVPMYEVIRRSVLNSPVVGGDETSVNINGKNNWVWTFQNDKATYIGIHPRRGYVAIEELMPEGFENTIIVSDCWASYFKINAKSHQICTAHILRELQYLTERYKNQTWSGRLTKLIKVALKTHRSPNIEPDIINRITNKLKEFLNEVIDKSFKKIIALQNRLIKYQDYLFLFLKNKLVPPDNNGSERAIRNFKVKQKVSGFFKTNKGAANYATLRSVCDTAIKNNQNPLIPFKLAAACRSPE